MLSMKREDKHDNLEMSERVRDFLSDKQRQKINERMRRIEELK